MSKQKIFIISTHPPGYPSGGAVSLKYRFEKLSEFYDLYILFRIRTDKSTPSDYFKKTFAITKTKKSNFFLFIYRYLFKSLYLIYCTVIFEKIKIVQIEHVKNLPYALLLCPLRLFFGVKIYYTAHDVFATYHPVSSLKFKLLKALELSFFNLFINKVFVWGKDDEKVLLGWGLNPKKLSILPIVMPPKLQSWVKKDKTDYVFIGTLGHAPNEEALNFILDTLWPVILEKKPDSILYLILGKDSHTFSTTLKNVVNCGYVNSVDDVMNKANISLAPIFSGVGIKTKIAESFAFGIPVITTDLGLLNFDSLDRQKVLVANTTEEYIKIIESINVDSIDLNAISQYERNYCETNLSDTVIKQYIQEFSVN